MTRVLIALAAVVLTSLAPVTGVAMPLAKIVAQTGLSPEDFKRMTAAEKTLFETAPKAGQSAAWDNPETGSNGTVAVASVREGCAYLRHAFHPKGQAAAEELNYRLCKAADGAWRLTP